MALTLARDGHDVRIVDRRFPIRGSTAASTALLQYELDLPLTALADRLGMAAARRAWQRSYRATRAIARLARDERIRCGLGLRQSLYLAGDAFGHRALRREAAARQEAGIPAEFLPHDALMRRFGVDRTGAILSPHAAVANPLQLAAALLRRAIARGARVHAPADVVDIAVSSRGRRRRTLTVSVEPDATFRAPTVVFCTGYELPCALPQSGHRILSTWALAARPNAALPAWLSRTTVWEASTPYLYLRTADGGALLAGGEDLPATRALAQHGVLRTQTQRVARKVEQLLPGLRLEVTHRWGGAFGASVNSLPIIDRIPDLAGAFVVAGFGGNGMTYSAIAAALLRARLAGHPDRDERLFRADR